MERFFKSLISTFTDFFKVSIAIGAFFGALLCAFCSFSPQSLTDEEQKQYEQMAILYYTDDSYNIPDGISISNYSNNMINVVDNNRPYTESITFTFDDDDNVTRIDSGINLAIIKQYPILLFFSIIGALAVCLVVSMLFTVL